MGRRAKTDINGINSAGPPFNSAMKSAGLWTLWPFNPLSSKIDGAWAGMANLAPGNFRLGHIRQGFVKNCCQKVVSTTYFMGSHLVRDLC